jgi:hypothetical protein
MDTPDDAALPAAPPIHTGLSDDGVKLAFAYFEHVEKQVALATTTSQLTVAATALLINAYVIAVKEYLWTAAAATERVRALFVCSGAFLIAGLVLALLSAIPNLRTRWGKQHDLRSIFYFKTVASMSPVEYIVEFRAADKKSGGFDNEILRQVWGKSYWVNRMFTRTQWAIRSIIGSTLLFIAALLLMYGYPVWLMLHKQP